MELAVGVGGFLLQIVDLLLALPHSTRTVLFHLAAFAPTLPENFPPTAFPANPDFKSQFHFFQDGVAGHAVYKYYTFAELLEPFFSALLIWYLSYFARYC